MSEPELDELAETYLRHMTGCYEAGRTDGRARGFLEGLGISVIVIVLMVLTVVIG